MDPVNDMISELQAMQSPLANMPRTMPYAVPEGYFAALSLEPVMREADPPLNLPKTMPFELPVGYFSGFSAASIIALDQDPELNLPKTLPFEVPQDYFEHFATDVLARVEAPAIGAIGAPKFDVPTGYFDGFADKMLAGAKAADREDTAIGEKRATRIINLAPQWKAIRWAAAAVAIMGIGIGSFMKFGGGTEAVPSAKAQLAQLDKALIRSYVQQHIDEFDTELLAENSPVMTKSATENINKLQGKDIQEYLNDEDLGDSGIN